MVYRTLTPDQHTYFEFDFHHSFQVVRQSAQNQSENSEKNTINMFLAA